MEKKIKVLSVFGTRPEAIKMSPLIKCLKADSRFEALVCVTAQHRDMLDQVLNIFDITPDYDLNIMKQSQTLEDITTRAIEGVSEVIKASSPDVVLVHGDTTTTFSGALAAYYNKVKSAHVEAGLRTENKFEPYPEEINRRLTSVLCDWHFAPTEIARQNLIKESLSPENIFVTGNTVIDALKTTVCENHIFSENALNGLNFKNKRIITVTAHRRENLGEPLENICESLKMLTETFSDVEIVYAVHKNPAVWNTAHEILGGISRIHLLEPLDLKDMHNLMSRSYFVMTDSGGLQEEVPSLGKPVLVLRNVTERPEGITAGTLKLVGTSKETIFRLAKTLLTDLNEYEKMSGAKNPFGDGFASLRIKNALLYVFGHLPSRPEDYK